MRLDFQRLGDNIALMQDELYEVATLQDIVAQWNRETVSEEEKFFISEQRRFLEKEEKYIRDRTELLQKLISDFSYINKKIADELTEQLQRLRAQSR